MFVKIKSISYPFGASIYWGVKLIKPENDMGGQGRIL